MAGGKQGVVCWSDFFEDSSTSGRPVEHASKHPSSDARVFVPSGAGGLGVEVNISASTKDSPWLCSLSSLGPGSLLLFKGWVCPSAMASPPPVTDGHQPFLRPSRAPQTRLSARQPPCPDLLQHSYLTLNPEISTETAEPRPASSQSVLPADTPCVPGCPAQLLSPGRQLPWTGFAPSTRGQSCVRRGSRPRGAGLHCDG